MTCTHVLGLIDAGPFADYPRAHLDAAWQHARQCATCGRALEVATALSTDLTALPQPAPSAELAPTVLARIAQAEQAQAARGPAAVPATGPASITRDWSAWATALGGVAAGLVIVLSMASGEGARISIASPKVGGMTAGLVAIPSMTTDALVLAAGLVLYAAGLFAPLSRPSRS
jgi:hypothetical protein